MKQKSPIRCSMMYMFTRLRSATLLGIDARIIEIEVDLKKGLPYQSIVGLPDPAVREARERVSAAIRNSGFQFPLGSLTVNLAPADLRKEGSLFDLAIALGILKTSGQLNAAGLFENYLFLGELSLDGSLRPVRGVLTIAEKAREKGFKSLFVPEQNFDEASLTSGITIYPLASLRDAVHVLDGSTAPPTPKPSSFRAAGTLDAWDSDFSEVRGQQFAIRAVEIAAAGGHNLLLIGSPGSGKTMIAARIPSILPPMSEDECLETTKIYSVAGLLPANRGMLCSRPFRMPHHTASDVSIIGGGKNPIPGEITLAHNGVLFMDEFPEFRSNIIQSLRQPLESGRITVARADSRLSFPACFMLVASMNPCPCGYLFDGDHRCRCEPRHINRYFMKISGPIIDRIDLQVVVSPLNPLEIMGGEPAESSSSIRRRVAKARSVQQDRFKGYGISRNAELEDRQLKRWCAPPESAKNLIFDAVRRFRLSARSYNRMLRVARTIADLDGRDAVNTDDILESLSYREVERILYGTVEGCGGRR
jgi:magnesium chelatase family protein